MIKLSEHTQYVYGKHVYVVLVSLLDTIIDTLTCKAYPGEENSAITAALEIIEYLDDNKHDDEVFLYGEEVYKLFVLLDFIDEYSDKVFHRYVMDIPEKTQAIRFTLTSLAGIPDKTISDSEKSLFEMGANVADNQDKVIPTLGEIRRRLQKRREAEEATQ